MTDTTFDFLPCDDCGGKVKMFACKGRKYRRFKPNDPPEEIPEDIEVATCVKCLEVYTTRDDEELINSRLDATKH